MRAVRIARSVGRPSRLKNPPGIFPACVHALFDVDREREEVRAFARLRPTLRRTENNGVAASDDDCAVCLLGELARLERDFLAADFDGNGNRHPGGVLSLNDAHLFPSSTVL